MSPQSLAGLWRTPVAAVGLLVAGGAVYAGLSAGAQGQVREWTIAGRDHAFSPARIEVQKDDLVKITFTAADMPHSFTVDHPYRISKRAGAGQSVTFEFRADQSGTFRFYCNLTADERCKNMRGELVVR
jgi:heme/copper-type cytochrome/quinol oxidase subunit 2